MTRKLLFAYLFATRITRLAAWLNRKKVTILCYHSVTRRPEANPNDPHKLHLRIDSFLEHLDYLQAHYQIISLAEFVRARRENIKLPTGAAILTFDDGMRNFFTVVAPLLLKRGIPATSFIVTGENFTQNESDLNGNWCPEDDDTYLSWSDVRHLAALGLEFGSHTCTHPSLPEIPPNEARSELVKSLDMLNANLGRKSFPLSYPHGKTSESISRLSQTVGYSCAVTTMLGQNDGGSDLFALRRTVIASDDDLPTFAARASGLTLWYNRIRELFSSGTSDSSESPSGSYDSLLAQECTTNKTF